MSNLFKPGKNCWRVEHADRSAVLIDGENYFRAVRKSLAQARQRIMLLGWDFDERVEMHDTAEEPEGPLKIGAYFDWLLKKNRDLNIYVLRWDTGALKSFFRVNGLLTLIRWYFHPRVHFKLDSHHPVGAAHHQKVIAIDEDTAFCSGIDVTNNRWDTRAHEDKDSHRLQPDGNDAGPWHDAAMVVQGAVACALSEYAVQHWQDAGGKKIKAVTVKGDCWPKDLEADFTDCPVAIARTMPTMDDQLGVHEIENLCLDLIAAAKDFIYAESQYFASARIAAALAARLSEPDGPEVVILNPQSAEGWLESEIMDSTRARLFEAVRAKDKYGRFRIFHPFNEAGTPIYVHAKIMIIDDRYIRIGSSNFNNRSLGFDSECDVAIDASEFEGDEISSQIARVRNDLLAEHLGVEEREVGSLLEETGSLIATIDRLNTPGRGLGPYETPDVGAVEEWLADNDILDPKRADDVIAGII
ncbi:phospholipase D-like domain-containing protein [Sphingorhabdus sp. SMR4y]|uniref:phospholipase D-like domain-containing protein n=1 Tax=Sphingorhabdus sp. SMR4y TaxID=2584094 RepID=UPI000B5CE16B|nr:phospholipase D-like domain-containing protein [Sphingorhabdus sp. SMR4y]ASK89594.1 cardiolipin synthetase [Sphingorhabdus sp. SMR4y]